MNTQDAFIRAAKTRSLRWPDWETLASTTARLLLLASLIYATWHYGAADSVALRNVSLLLAAATALVLTCKRTYRSGKSRLPLPFLMLCMAWLVLGMVQQTRIAALLPWSFSGVREVHETFAQQGIDALNTAASELSSDVYASPPSRAVTVASVHPETTRQALVPFALAAVVAVLSSMLLNTTRWRRWLLWCVIANGTSLAFWGIIQRAGDGRQILPGIENRFSDAMPFGSFIYKNAGAAALLPALAAVAALLYLKSADGRSRRRHWDRGGAQWFETGRLTLCSCGLLMAIGLAVSLSRGAWIAALASAVAAAAVVGGRRLTRGHWIGVIIVGVLGAVIVSAVGLKHQVRDRAAQFSVDYVFKDQRWPQWQDGWATALSHLPAGSGLGTYGYATLPQQDETRKSWFREAHNQYLEVFTESGLPGVMLLAVAIVWFGCVVRRSLSRTDREARSWGLVGLILLVGGGLQSLFDFVLVIPANLMLYAALIAVISTLDACAIRSTVSMQMPVWRERWRGWMHANATNSRAVWSAFACLALMMAYQTSSQQVRSDAVLQRVRVANLQIKPQPQQLASDLAILNDAIARHPTRAGLYLRRAHFHLAAYRLQLRQSTLSQPHPLAWEETQIEHLFAVLSNQPPGNAESVRKGLLAGKSLRAELDLALADLAKAIELEPLSPRSHLACAMVAPLVQMPVEPWLQRTAALSNNSSELLYLNGLFAIWCGRDDFAIDQWERSLSINHTYLEHIFQISQQVFSPLQVAASLVPPNRADLYLRLMESDAQAFHDTETSSRKTYDAGLAEAMIEQVQADESIEVGIKHATIAEIRFRLGDYEAEARRWREALRVRSRDPDYRLRYSHSLYRLGQNEEALKQAVLGQTLNPGDARFEQVAALIRQRMKVGIRR